MSASTIVDTAPFGALIRYTDGSPKPPARFTKNLAAWERSNGVGRLVKKEPPRSHPTWTAPASFTLHEGNFASDGIILVTILRSHSADSRLIFEVVERPKAAQVRVLLDFGGNMELLHLAESITAADLWIAREGYRNARLEIVGESGARQSYLQMGRRIPHMQGGERRGAQVCYFHRPQVRVNVQTARPLIGCAQNHRSGIWFAILPHRGQCRVARRACRS